MSESAVGWLQKGLFICSLLAAWEIVYRFGGWPTYLLPGPSQVAMELWNGLASGMMLEAVAVSLRRAAVAFGLALVLGVLIG